MHITPFYLYTYYQVKAKAKQVIFKIRNYVHYFRYYADIRQTISASDQEMNSALAELSRVRAATPQSPDYRAKYIDTV